MKIKSISLLFTMFLMSLVTPKLVNAQCMMSHNCGGMSHSMNDQDMKDKGTQAPMIYYTCSMDPDIISDKPGKCSKCGMDLVKKEGKLYTCSMHPDVLRAEPGKCPKCSMELIVKQVDSYTCSMHPDVISDKPGKCPKCGMELIKKDPANQHKSHGGHGMMH